MASAQISIRDYSIHLQRAVTDLAAVESYGRTVKKMKEHYGMDIPESSVMTIAAKHAHAIKSQRETLQKFQSSDPIVEHIIAQADGAMVPIVERQEDAPGEKTKNLFIVKHA